MPIKTVDLFCGIGGLTRGFIDENLEVVAGYDIDSTCRFPYEFNNGAQFIEKDVRDITAEELNAHYQDATVRVLIGCAPCQPFSSYAFKSPDIKEDVAKAKWGLLYQFARLVEACQPEIVSMENVPGLAKNEKSVVFKNFLRTLTENGYEIDYKIVYCPDYGIPQSRKRLVLLASRLGKINLIQETHNPNTYRTVEQTIGHLEPLESGQISTTDPIHRAARLSDKNLIRIRQSVQGGTWRDWDTDLVLDCHRKPTGRTYPSVYGRMRAEEPAPTMTTFCTGIGNGRFGHPTQDRAISLREAALFQTFPADYRFAEDEDNVLVGQISTHIGNAVPVELGRVIARSINFHLQNYAN